MISACAMSMLRPGRIMCPLNIKSTFVAGFRKLVFISAVAHDIGSPRAEKIAHSIDLSAAAMSA